MIMYLINDELPDNCFSCVYKTKCDIWHDFLKLPEDKQNEILDAKNLYWFRPFYHPNCKFIYIPPRLIRFYLKWIKRLCPHLCIICRHSHKCEIYQIGEENVQYMDNK